MKIGIIGTGVMGVFYGKLLHEQVSGATVVAVADPAIERVKAAAAAIPGALAFTCADELIAHPDVEAVLFASPDELNVEQVLACIAAGKPVLCEKPPSSSVEDAERVVAAHRAAVGRGTPLVHIGFMRRFDPGYVAQKREVDSGVHGHPVMVHSVGRGVATGPGETDESVIFNFAIHDLDTVSWLLASPVTQVSWSAPEQPSPVSGGLHEPFLLLLRTADGALSTVENSLNVRYGYDMRCEVLCELGSVKIAEPQRIVTRSEFATRSDIPEGYCPRFAEAYRLQLQEWVTALNEGRAPKLATVEDGARATRVAAAAVASMRAGGAFVDVVLEVEPALEMNAALEMDAAMA